MELSNSHIDYLKQIVVGLPETPGVYQFYSKDENVIYIGKAKNLKKRVSSYFSGRRKDGKTTVLVNKIADIKHIIVETEQDALLLENNLIKKYLPRYNVLLKDDKTFPWICIKNEPFPRVFSTRNRIEDGSEYFGPFTSGRLVKIILDLVKQLFSLRTCNYSLTESNINSGKFRVCLEYHIGNCKAPCIGDHSQIEYNQQIDSIRNILKGNISSVRDYMNTLMKEYSGTYQFEKAEQIKQKLVLLRKFQSRSTIVSVKLNNIDVFSFVDKEKYAYVNFLKVVAGSVIQSHTIELKRKLEETAKELLELAIIDIRNKLFSNSTKAIIPFDVDYQLENVKFIVPQRGEKKMLLDLSERNAKYFAKEREQQRLNLIEKSPALRIMRKMQDDFNLSDLPYHIECFDNSNLGGTTPVASCVVFKNLKPARKEYRHFNIKTVVGADDYKSMNEVVSRRYKRMLDEKKQLPQLIVIDGGKGQLSSAYEALKSLNLTNKISIVGIAKRLEEIYFPNDSVPLYLDKNSESLKVIQHIRNEAHRFAITFHRDKRLKAFVRSDLNLITGIGDATIIKLLKEFRSVKNIQSADIEDLQGVVGLKKAQSILDFFAKRLQENS